MFLVRTNSYKGQEISEAILTWLQFSQKNNDLFFIISALVFKMGKKWINKGTLVLYW